MAIVGSAGMPVAMVRAMESKVVLPYPFSPDAYDSEPSTEPASKASGLAGAGPRSGNARLVENLDGPESIMRLSLNDSRFDQLLRDAIGLPGECNARPDLKHVTAGPSTAAKTSFTSPITASAPSEAAEEPSKAKRGLMSTPFSPTFRSLAADALVHMVDTGPRKQPQDTESSVTQSALADHSRIETHSQPSSTKSPPSGGKPAGLLKKAMGFSERSKHRVVHSNDIPEKNGFDRGTASIPRFELEEFMEKASDTKPHGPVDANLMERCMTTDPAFSSSALPRYEGRLHATSSVELDDEDDNYIPRTLLAGTFGANPSAGPATMIHNPDNIESMLSKDFLTLDCMHNESFISLPTASANVMTSRTDFSHSSIAGLRSLPTENFRKKVSRGFSRRTKPREQNEIFSAISQSCASTRGTATSVGSSSMESPSPFKRDSFLSGRSKTKAHHSSNNDPSDTNSRFSSISKPARREEGLLWPRAELECVYEDAGINIQAGPTLQDQRLVTNSGTAAGHATPFVPHTLPYVGVDNQSNYIDYLRQQVLKSEGRLVPVPSIRTCSTTAYHSPWTSVLSASSTVPTITPMLYFHIIHNIVVVELLQLLIIGRMFTKTTKNLSEEQVRPFMTWLDEFESCVCLVFDLEDHVLLKWLECKYVFDSYDSSARTSTRNYCVSLIERIRQATVKDHIEKWASQLCSRLMQHFDNVQHSVHTARPYSIRSLPDIAPSIYNFTMRSKDACIFIPLLINMLEWDLDDATNSLANGEAVLDSRVVAGINPSQGGASAPVMMPLASRAANHGSTRPDRVDANVFTTAQQWYKYYFTSSIIPYNTMKLGSGSPSPRHLSSAPSRPRGPSSVASNTSPNGDGSSSARNSSGSGDGISGLNGAGSGVNSVPWLNKLVPNMHPTRHLTIRKWQRSCERSHDRVVEVMYQAIISS